MILIGTFKKTWDKHVTFTTIRPYIQGCQSLTICDHINLFRKDVERAIDIHTLVKDRKYYIIGFCESYRNDDRMGVKLATEYSFCPILEAGDIKKVPSDVFSVCFRFSPEQYLASKQRHMLL